VRHNPAVAQNTRHGARDDNERSPREGGHEKPDENAVYHAFRSDVALLDFHFCLSAANRSG
jgi:hypothetical protein